MHAYTFVPLVACVVLSALALSIWTRGLGTSVVVRPIAVLFGCTAFWAFCEVLWNLAPDAATATFVQRLSAPGWMLLGPLCLDGVVTGRSARRRTWPWLQGLYMASGLGVVLTWGSPWMLETALRTSWGFAPVPGPLFVPFYLVTGICVGGALRVWIRGVRRTRDPEQRARGPYVAAALLIPLIVCSLTDVLLPVLGWQVPRFGTASLALLGVLHAVTYQRNGLSVLLPEAFSERILHMLPDGVAIAGVTGRLRTVNPGLLRLLGATPDEVVGKPLGPHLSERVFGEGAPEVRELECQLRPWNLEGRPIPVAVSTIALPDSRGRTQGLIVVVRDLREVAALRSRLLTSGRLAAVGQLAAGIAHEINTPIAYVRANLGVLRGHWETLEAHLEKRGSQDPANDEAIEHVLVDGAELLEETLQGVDRAADIVRDVREFSHGRSEETPRPSDLDRLLDQTVRVARPQLSPGLRIEREGPSLRDVPCHPHRLLQVFLNLLLNADQAIRGAWDAAADPEGPTGRVLIRTRIEDGWVVVQWIDDGPGIPPDVRERVFDPFFTTKPVGEGTGLGLAIAYEILRQHSGELEIDCPEGGGTIVTVRLPT